MNLYHFITKHKKKELLFHKYAQIFIRIRIKRILFLRDGKIRMFLLTTTKGKITRQKKRKGWKNEKRKRRKVECDSIKTKKRWLESNVGAIKGSYIAGEIMFPILSKRVSHIFRLHFSTRCRSDE